MSRVLVTGGAGFIGCHLVRRLIDEGGHQIVIADDFARGRRDEAFDGLLAARGVALLEADLADPAAWARLGGGFDEVYHFAAIVGVRNVIEHPDAVIRVNALSTLYLLEWMANANRGARLLFSSTSESYAWTQRFHALPTPTPEDVPLALTDLANPRSAYAASKLFGEAAVTQYGRTRSLEFVIARFHNVYGPRMGWEHVIPELYERATAGQDPLVVYEPDHSRAFCYVSDAIDAALRAMRSDAAAGATFNVGDDREEIAIGDLARRILRLAGRAGAPIAARASDRDPIRRRCPDLGRARRVLGYEPRVSLDEGLARTLDWYARHPRPAAAPG